MVGLCVVARVGIFPNENGNGNGKLYIYSVSHCLALPFDMSLSICIIWWLSPEKYGTGKPFYVSHNRERVVTVWLFLLVANIYKCSNRYIYIYIMLVEAFGWW